MSDTCIVCLGDLSIGSGEVVGLSIVGAKSPLRDDVTIKSEFLDGDTVKVKVEDPNLLIANIKPCDHVLHNECLTPWVERANSCPICRASFHLVELKATVGGPTISSYAVQDRQQVAELDPTMFLEMAEEEEDDTPCQNCGEDDNEDVLMFCDGCQKMWHTYCVGLHEVPYGAWFCDNCRSQRTYNPRPTVTARTVQPGRRRTRGQQRRRRTLQVGQDHNWNEVWQSVWSRINLDLDFPYDDDETSAAYIRRHRQRNVAESRAAHDAWQTRLRVAELQGAGNRFRETEPTLAALPHQSRTPVNQTQDAEEVLAWDAFDAARATSAEPSSARRGKKRKTQSPSPTPEQADPTPARVQIKRRRTSQSAASPSTHTRGRRVSRPVSPVPRRPLTVDSSGPTFLQSLLQEVEAPSSTTGIMLNANLQRPIRAAGSPPATDHGSPRPSSPAGSPLPSNHSSPRAMSLSPPPGHRPGSPTTLSSSIQPIYADRESSPVRDRLSADTRPPSKQSSETVAQPVPRPRPRLPPVLGVAPTSSRSSRHPTPIQTNHSSPPPPSEASPTRANMSLSAKSHIQRLVSTALKPLYNDATITKDEYTVINRDVSRMLYERIGDVEGLVDEQRSKWEKVAGEEVGRAVVALKANA